MTQDRPARYNITVANKPGELVKLTKFLSDAGVNVSVLRVANLGSTASIQFETAGDLAATEGGRDPFSAERRGSSTSRISSRRRASSPGGRG